MKDVRFCSQKLFRTFQDSSGSFLKASFFIFIFYQKEQSASLCSPSISKSFLESFTERSKVLEYKLKER